MNKKIRNINARMRRFTLAIKLMVMKRKADRLARKTGKRFFIVNMGGQARILSKAQFKHMRQHGLFPLSFTAAELKKIALYDTKK